LNKIWSAAVSIDVTDDPTLIRAMAHRQNEVHVVDSFAIIAASRP
jgi:hypothetical protein